MGEIRLPTLGYFKNGNGYLGSAGALRFQIEPTQGRDCFPLVLWQGPFSRPYAQEIGRESFPLDGDGLAALKRFLAEKAQEMEEHPVFTDAETTAYYQAKKQEELSPPPGE